MQSGSLATGIPEWRCHVEVNGVARDVVSVQIDADIASDLPGSVAGVSGVSPRTGSIQWARQMTVEEMPPSPWSGVSWPPRPGDSVEVWAGDAGTSWKVFTGVIDSTTGGVDSLSSRIVDRTDQLDREVSLEPVAWKMPGGYDEATDTARTPVVTGVQPWHAAYRCLRAGGFAIPTPTQPGATVLHVDMQGSVMPERGELRYDYEAVSLEWGEGWMFLADNLVNYRLTGTQIGTGSVLRFWLRWNASLSSTASVIVALNEERRIRVDGSIDPATAQVTVKTRVWAGDPDSSELLGSWTDTRLAAVDHGTAWVDVAVPVSGDVKWTLPQTDVPTGTRNGSASFTGSMGAGPVAGTAPTTASVWGPLVSVQVGVLTLSQWEAMSSHTDAPGVHSWGSGLVRSQYVSRTQVRRSARDLLDEIGRATLTAMWVDEYGVMQWAPTNRVYTGMPVRVFTTRDDIFDLGWTESLQATRRRVMVDLDAVALKIAEDGFTKTVWRGRGVEVAPGSTDEWIAVPSDEEWFGVDTTMWRASAVADRMNARKGSFYSAVRELPNDEYAIAGPEYVATLQQVTPAKFKLTHANSSSTTLQSMTHPTHDVLRTSLRGIGMPLVRAQGVATFSDMTVTGSTAGPEWAPDLTLDVGSWAIAGHAQAVADWLSARLSRPLITLTDVEVAYDPRIQLGDTVSIDSTTFHGVRVNAVVVGKRESHGDGSRLSLTVRVIGLVTAHATYEEFEAAYTGSSYRGLESAWEMSTYQALENAPMTRS